MVTTIPGVREDVTDMVLNIKLMALRMEGEGPKNAFNGRGSGEVTAGIVDTGADVELMNPDLVLCALDKGATLTMEFTVETGKAMSLLTQIVQKIHQ